MYNVLLVDDEPFIVDGLEVLINWDELNLNVIGKAYNGEEAYNFMRYNHVDILVTDIRMPKLTGLELIGQAKTLCSDCYFIVLSGYTDFEYVKESVKLGIENYLTKPVNTNELEQTLKNIVDKLDNETKKIPFSSDNQEWHILRGNILSRWVNHAITAEELLNRSDLLNIIINSTAYSVAVINVQLSGPANSKISQIYNLCYNYIKSDTSIMSFEDTQGNFVLICAHEPYPGRHEYLLNLLKEIQHNIRNLNVTSHITLGPTVSSYKDIADSYDVAMKLFEYFMIYPNKQILCSDIIEGPSAQLNKPFDVDHNYIASCLLSKEDEALFDYMDQIFEKCVSTQGINPSHMRLVVTEILLNLYNSVSSQSILFHNDMIHQHSKLLHKLHDIHHLDLLKEALKGYFMFIINQVEQKEYARSPVVNQIMHYIHKHYDQELSLKTLSLKYNINSAYLGQLFKKETGVSFPNYINNYRVEMAKDYLNETNLKTSQIAKKVGFIDPNYFYRIFKKYAGMSPTDYKMIKV